MNKNKLTKNIYLHRRYLRSTKYPYTSEGFRFLVVRPFFFSKGGKYQLFVTSTCAALPLARYLESFKNSPEVRIKLLRIITSKLL